MTDANHALKAIGLLPDAEIDIANAALQIARLASPGADWARASAHLSELAREAAAIGLVMSDRPVEVRLGALVSLIHVRHRYAGDVDTYDDLANADLIRVTERRRGLPVALGILWLHCIRAAGWSGRGIDFPRHFLVRLDGRPTQATVDRRAAARLPHAVVDVFAGGTEIDVDGLLGLVKRRATDERTLEANLFRPMSNREVLLRLQRNIAERQRLSGRHAEALATWERMALFANKDPAIWREKAALNQQLGRLPTAIACLERFLTLAPDGADADRARLGIDAMRRRLA